MEEHQNEAVWHLSNTLLNDAQISFKAKGIFLYILLSNKKKGLSMEMLKKASNADSERSIKVAIKELEKNGYVIQNVLKQGETRWTYNLNRNVNEKKRVEATTTDKKQHPQKKNPQGRKSTRKQTIKKTGFNHAIGSFLKELF